MSSGGELVSVIVPIYKVEEYLRECVDSIINQTYKNLEIILVDDGSPDKCGEICEEYARNDSRITVYHKENGGLSDARNYGIARSHGEYITFVDSDDVIKENFVEALMGLIHNHDADIAMLPLMNFSTSIAWETEMTHDYCVSPHDALIEILYQRGTDVCACSKIYRRDLWDGIQFPKGMYYEDLATIHKLILRSVKIAYSNEKLYAYRMRQGSIMKTRFSPNMMHIITATRTMFSEVTEKYPDLKNAASSKAFSGNRSVYLFFPFSSKKERMQVWAEMKKYRCTVIFDAKARKRERIAALLSYLGADLFHILFSWLYKKRQMTC